MFIRGVRWRIPRATTTSRFLASISGPAANPLLGLTTRLRFPASSGEGVQKLTLMLELGLQEGGLPSP